MKGGIINKAKCGVVSLISGSLMTTVGLSGWFFVKADNMSDTAFKVVNVAVFVGGGLIALSVILFILAGMQKE